MDTDEKRLEAVGGDEIVVIGETPVDESPSGHVEAWTEDVVFSRGGKWYRTTINYTRTFIKAGFSAWLEGTQEISAAEYARLSSGNTPMNVPSIRTQIAQREAALAAAEAAKPNCPKCGKKMTVRTGNFPAFWGCSDFSKSGCTGKLKK